MADQPQAARLLQEGCTHMRNAFDIEALSLDDLIATALNDPQAVAGDIANLKGITSE